MVRILNWYVQIKFRIKHDFWCPHVWTGDPPHWRRTPDHGGWEMIDLGRLQMRTCPNCKFTEFR